MKPFWKTLAALLALCACVAPAFAVEQAVDLRPEMTIPRLQAGQRPVIDGKLDEWTQPPVATEFVDGGEFYLVPAAVQSRAWVAYDDENLYIAYRNGEPDPSKIQTHVTDRDGQTWTDDAVEVVIDPKRELMAYYQIVINAKGVVFDHDTGEIGWDSNCKTATSVGKDYWAIEMAIPFSALGGKPKPGTEWGFNVCRDRCAEGGMCASWSFAYSRFLNTSYFGHLRFGAEPPVMTVESGDSVFFGGNTVSVKVTNPSAKAGEYRLVCEMGVPGGKIPVTEKALQIPAGGSVTESVPAPIKTGAEKMVALTLSDQADGSVQQKIVLPVAATPASQVSALRARINGLAAVVKNSGISAETRTRLTGQVERGQAALKDFDTLAAKAVDEGRQITKAEWAANASAVGNALAAARGATSVLWTKSPWENLQPGEMPPSLDDISGISVRSCVAERVPVVFNLTNLDSVDYHFRAELSAWRCTDKGREAFTIDPSQIKMREVMFFSTRNGSIYADPLPLARDSGDVTVPPLETRQVWLSVDTRDVAPGHYEGVVALIPFDSDLSNKGLKVSLDVMPVELPAKMPIATYTWDYARSDSYVRDLRANRINVMLVGNGLTLPKCDKDGNILSLDFTAFDQALRMKRRYGDQVMFSYGVVRSFEVEMAQGIGLKYMSEPWKKAFREYLTRWVAHLKDLGLGYNDFTMQIWDEATGDENPKLVAQVGPFLREIDPKIRWVMDGAQNLKEAKLMDPWVDIWIPHLDTVMRMKDQDRKELMEFYHSSGKAIWGYTCRTEMTEQPVIGYYRTKPWVAWKLNLAGICFWAYNSWRGNSWTDAERGTEGYSDNGVIYEGYNSPVDSRRWEAFQKGLEDYLMFYQIRQAATKARGAGKAAEAAQAEQTVSTAVDELLVPPDDSAKLDKYVGQVQDTLLRMTRLVAPAVPSAPKVRPSRGGATVSWTVSAPCSAAVYYRLPGEDTWRKAEAAKASADCSVKLAGLQPGVEYQYFTRSVSPEGYVQLSDNGGKLFTFRAGK